MSAWQLLGIEPSAEAKVIKRAYAVKLKQTNPQDDPAGFQALRSAYEWALNWAERARWEALHAETTSDDAASNTDPLYVSESEAVASDAAQADAVQFEAEPSSASITEPAANVLSTVTVTTFEGRQSEPLVEEPPHEEPQLAEPITSTALSEVHIEVKPPRANDSADSLLTANDDALTGNAGNQAPVHVYEDTETPTQRMWREAHIKAHALVDTLLLHSTPHQLEQAISQFFEQDWFIHLDAKDMLEVILLDAIATEQLALPYLQCQALVQTFAWDKPSLLQRHLDAWALATVNRLYRHQSALHHIDEAKHAAKPSPEQVVIRSWLEKPNALKFRWLSSKADYLNAASQLIEEWDNDCPDIFETFNQDSVAKWRDKVNGVKAAAWLPLDLTTFLLFLAAIFIGSIIGAIANVDEMFFLPIDGLVFIALVVARKKISNQYPDPSHALRLKQQTWYEWLNHQQMFWYFLTVMVLLMALIQATTNPWLATPAMIAVYAGVFVWSRYWEFFKRALFVGLPWALYIGVIPPYLHAPFFILHVFGMWMYIAGMKGWLHLSNRHGWTEEKLGKCFSIWYFVVLLSPLFISGMLANHDKTPNNQPSDLHNQQNALETQASPETQSVPEKLGTPETKTQQQTRHDAEAMLKQADQEKTKQYISGALGAP